MVSVALMDPIRVVRDFADADSIELATLEAVIGMVGAGLGKPNMESMAKEIAASLVGPPISTETWGDLRVYDAAVMKECGLRTSDAYQLVKFFGEAKYSPVVEEAQLEGESLGSADSFSQVSAAAQDQEEDDEEVVVQEQALLQEEAQAALSDAAQAVLQYASRAEGSQGADVLSGATTVTQHSGGSQELSQAISALASGLIAPQQQLLAAAAAKARGKINPLTLKDGVMPSVKATRQWMLHVAELHALGPGAVLHKAAGFYR